MLTFPRILGVLVLIWGARGVVESAVTLQPFWIATTVLWLLAGGHLVALLRVRAASWTVVGLSGLEMVVRVPNLTGLELLAWIALIVAVTERRPHDRALLLRTCATVVYAFTALTKLNPSWLAGEGVAGLILRRSQLTSFQFVADSASLATAVAIGIVALEAWLAMGLWIRRTRSATAAVGVLMHAAFVVLASPNMWAAVHLTIFNFGLVACYPAFWSSIRPPSRTEKRSVTPSDAPA